MLKCRWLCPQNALLWSRGHSTTLDFTISELTLVSLVDSIFV